MSKKTSLALKLAVLSIPLVTMSNSYIAPALARVAAAFPEASATGVQLIMTVAMFGSFPMTLLSGGLASRFRSKTVVMAALTCLLVGGFLPVFLHSSLLFLYLSAFLMGAGQGTLLTMMGTITAELFEGEERSRMFGLQGSVQEGGYMAMTATAGFLCSITWYYAYFTSALMIPTFLLVLFLLPRGKDPRASAPAAGPAQANPAPKRGLPPAAAWPIALFLLLLNVGFATNVLNSAMLLESSGMGGPTLAGVLTSLSSLVSIAAGVIYKPLSRLCRSHILSLSGLLTVAGMLFAGQASSVPVYFLGSALIAVGYILGFSGGMDCIALVVPPEKTASSMGLFMACQSLGAMISPTVINALTQLITGRLQVRDAYMVSTGFLAVLLVLAIVWGVANRKRFQAVPATA